MYNGIVFLTALIACIFAFRMFSLQLLLKNFYENWKKVLFS